MKRDYDSFSEDLEEETQVVDALLDCHLGIPSTLPTIKEVENNRRAYVGPTDESNWVIPGKLLVGAYPAEIDNEAHFSLLRSILSCGVTTFVCLQREYDHHCFDVEAWKQGTKIRPYINDAYRILKTSVGRESSSSNFCHPAQLKMMHIPIADCDVTSDQIVAKLAEALCWRLIAGEILYIHCWGGHGRTGTLVAIMLGMLYKISKAECLKRTQLYHDLRTCPLYVPSPQTFNQRMQVLRILDGWHQNKKSSIVDLHRSNSDLWQSKCTLGSEFLLPIEARINTDLRMPCKSKRRKVVIPLNTTNKASGQAKLLRPLKPPATGSENAVTPKQKILQPHKLLPIDDSPSRTTSEAFLTKPRASLGFLR